MVMKTFKNIIIAFLLINSFISHSFACGWYDDVEAYRLSAFRVEISELLGYRAFYYTPQYLNSYLPASDNKDLYKNCYEWKKIIGGKIRIEDVFTILYKVEPDLFFLAYNDKELGEKFEGNTFITQLQLKKNSDWLEYLAFAKKNEYNNMYVSDPWTDSYDNNFGRLSHELIQIAENKLKKINDQLLQERYAYHLIRLYRQTGDNDLSISTYNKYFNNKSESILKNWSLLHVAEAYRDRGEKVKANYLFSKVFYKGEEKRIRAYKLFRKDLFDKTLALAENNSEKATLWAIMAIKNPGPAMDQIIKVAQNDPHHKTIPLLIMREINKLEDWIFTPEFTEHTPGYHYTEGYNEWNEDYKKIKETNRLKDIAYLKKFNSFLENNYAKFSPETKDYIKLARAHLHLILRENEKAFQLFNSIDEKAPQNIQIQKNIEQALYYVFEGSINNFENQEKLAAILTEADKKSKYNNNYRKQLQTLCTILSKEYLKQGNIVFAGLINLKAKDYKHAYESQINEWVSEWKYKDYYWKIAFFDRFAKPEDIDLLLKLIEKKQKNTFESYLCNQELASKNALLDLKGTLAFRNGQIEKAAKAFSIIPKDFWSENYEFSNYLNEDPFRPPNMEVSAKAYRFHKAELLKELGRLKEEAKTNKNKSAENYIKIGHFFYNSSYWGNSWMMMNYSWTAVPQYHSTTFGYHDVLFGDLLENAKGLESNYYNCKEALKYYELAEKYAKNNEQLAMIYFMKHVCFYKQFVWEEKKKPWGEKNGTFKPKYIKDLFEKYSNTETFKQIRCSRLDDFAEAIGVDY